MAIPERLANASAAKQNLRVVGVRPVEHLQVLLRLGVVLEPDPDIDPANAAVVVFRSLLEQGGEERLGWGRTAGPSGELRDPEAVFEAVRASGGEGLVKLEGLVQPLLLPQRFRAEP